MSIVSFPLLSIIVSVLRPHLEVAHSTHVLFLSFIPAGCTSLRLGIAAYRVPDLTLTPAELQHAFVTESPGNPRKTEISEAPAHQTFPSLLLLQI